MDFCLLLALLRETGSQTQSSFYRICKSSFRTFCRENGYNGVLMLKSCGSRRFEAKQACPCPDHHRDSKRPSWSSVAAAASTSGRLDFVRVYVSQQKMAAVKVKPRTEGLLPWYRDKAASFKENTSLSIHPSTHPVKVKLCIVLTFFGNSVLLNRLDTNGVLHL